MTVHEKSACVTHSNNWLVSLNVKPSGSTSISTALSVVQLQQVSEGLESLTSGSETRPSTPGSELCFTPTVPNHFSESAASRTAKWIHFSISLQQNFLTRPPVPDYYTVRFFLSIPTIQNSQITAFLLKPHIYIFCDFALLLIIIFSHPLYLSNI